MDKFRAVWEKIDAVLFQLLRHVCAVILGALVAVVFYIFFGRYVMHNSPMWGEPFSLLMGLMVVGCGTFALCVLEPQLDFGRLLFEQISAYSTAGLSTGITAELCPASRVVLILTMFIGRVGAVTLLSLWVERPEPTARYTEEAITIG